MQRPVHTAVIGLVAAVVAFGGGAFVARAADHAAFAGASSQQGGPGNFGGGPPNGTRPTGQPPGQR